MSIKDAIKSIEEADEKLKKATELENKAIATQRDAARLRQESDESLRNVREESAALAETHGRWLSDSEKKEQELKNREVKLTGGQTALLNKITENNKDFDTSSAALDARAVAADKADRQNKEEKERLEKVAEKYNSIATFIENLKNH